MEQLERLKPGARLFWNEALKIPERHGHKEPGLHHFLLALLERHGAMAESLASGLKADDYRRRLEQRLKQGEIGEPIEPQALLKEAVERAEGAGKEEVSERDLAAILLKHDGWALLVQPAAVSTTSPPVTTGVAAAKESAKMPAATEPAKESTASGEEAADTYRPRARQPTPTLEHFGRDLCQEAIEGKLPKILGREMELQAAMETLCRWTKRNPLLVGPAGVGKTAIIEGLAQQVVAGTVPPPLQGVRLFAIQASALVSGAGRVGMLEERMQTLLKEASQDGIVLFIDEVHTIVGSGGMRQVSDVGSLLKPALARGEIACIGATTDAEFHQFIEQDRALERRFQPLRVQELSADATLEILKKLRERAREKQGVDFSDEALRLIVLLAQQYLRNRYFPDKAIDVFEQCAAHATLQGLDEVTSAVVHDVAERMVGIPIDLGSELTHRLGKVKDYLVAQAFCPAAAADQVVNRLEVTMRGLDVDPARPNAVLLVADTSGEVPELTAAVLSQALFSSRDRVIEIDMSRFTHASDVNWLVGAPPGYVGHDQSVGFQLELAQQPWSVLLFKNVEVSHPQAQEFLAQAFRSGYFTDNRGRRVYLSDATVVMTVTTEKRAAARPLGFLADEESEEMTPEAEAPDLSSLLLPDLVEEIDVSWWPDKLTAERVQRWVKAWVLPEIMGRYRQQGLEVAWDDNFVEWLAESIRKMGDLTQGERLLEEEVLPLLVPYLNESGTVYLSYYKEEGNVRVWTGESD